MNVDYCVRPGGHTEEAADILHHLASLLVIHLYWNCVEIQIKSGMRAFAEAFIHHKLGYQLVQVQYFRVDIAVLGQ